MSASQIFSEIVKTEEAILKCSCAKSKKTLQNKLEKLEDSI